MQYSILVLPGPEKAWQTLKSSWYCTWLRKLDVSDKQGSLQCPYHLLIEPGKLIHKLVMELEEMSRMVWKKTTRPVHTRTRLNQIQGPPIRPSGKTKSNKKKEKLQRWLGKLRFD